MQAPAALTLLILALPASVLAQQPAAKVTIKALPALMAQTKVTPDSAEAIALAKVPGTIAEAEFENECHRLIYSFDIKVAGRAGITEVNVDAKTGAVAGVSHEGSADEAREKAHEKGGHSKRVHPAKMDSTSQK